jgi:PAS domain S-box-containing protein
MPKRGWNIAASGHEWLPLLGLALAWTMVMGGSLLWNQHLVQHKVLENARLEADTIVNKDHAYRRWASMHGGVYVHPTEDTPPNVWLDHPRRDVVTTDGDQLTLMNPAYMARQMMALFGEQYGVKGHITSLKLKNPANVPDDWERTALLQLEHGAQTVSQTAVIDDQPYLRLLLPMYMEQSCLRCHADTGVALGGVRGGISTAVPLQRHQLVAAEELKALRLAHGGIWLLGLTLLIGGNNLYRRQKTVLLTAEGALANSQVRFAALTQSSPTGVFQTEPDGSYNFVNDQWCLLAGITPQQAHDDGWHQVIHPDDRSKVLDAWQHTISERRPFRLEYRFMRPDGKTTWVYGQSSVMQDANGKVIGHVGTVTDISEHKELEQTLRTAKELADDANRAKSEFLATISHELRTPLNAVMGGAQLLEMTTLNQEQRDYLAMVNIGAKQELALVNDLLDLTAIEAGGVQLCKTPFLLRASLSTYTKKRHEDCQLKGLQLNLDIDDQVPEAILGDEQRFIQAIDILMDNAIKFTDQGTISLSIKPLHLSGAQATLSICVADSGIGIAPEQHEQIFMPFMQADMSHTRKHGGTGLGLSICRRLALAMGGTVRVESTVGKGSSFYLELPFDLCVARPPSTLTVSQEAAEQDRPSASQATGGASPRCRPGSK